MSSTTTKRGLYKPAQSDYVRVLTDIANNMDNLDDAVPDSRKINGHALTSDVTVTKGDVGLGSVNNTSDADKPVSNATQTALDLKLDANKRGAANGVASLDANGKVPESQIPDKAQDIVMANSKSAFPATGNTSKVYIAKDTNRAYRWTGSAYQELSRPEQIIDDTAGDGSTAKTWSADKLHDTAATKADKVTGSTNGDLAGLDANGNLTDSGKKPADFVLVADIATVEETREMIADYYGGD